ncbi:MAG: hypothetical protein COZ15_02540 [Elusimicrobia bacterium CG_4_10_14_3_um_filter_49_12_50_7]|nr:MAG: hypothetical protein COS41_06310 [Elusimicrobia bacterium CG03_land_8_20_14_0_80_50_18]PIX14063.1 MAG: hypothetical protein COZ72_06915 [Elusimicrobia bacterium CG_4_8_14_3_um_filter_50_9]PIY17505.1 MAG: hypothetical protein COZ15_02540 [Elusimicrobia bacterium CG_4_10_14_3_um_filter_49_12_50_7]
MPKSRIIIDALKEVIIEKGVRKITAEAIAKKAGIAKGTLYLYFKTKEDMLSALVEDFLKEGEAMVKSAMASDGGAIARLRAFVKADLNFYEKNHRLFRTLGMETSAMGNLLDRTKKKMILKRYFAIVDTIAGAVSEAIGEKKIEKMPPVEGAVLLIQIIHAYAGMRIHELSKRPIVGNTDKVMKIFLNGVGA